jgi:3-oxoacyl-[acyl-carrier protein] reductase
VDQAERRTVLVTGAGRNIGRAIALAFAAAGDNVAINVRKNTDEGNAVMAEVGRLGAEAMVVVGDVGDPETDDRLVASVVERFGPVDVLVNNAAVRPKQPLLSISEAVRPILSVSARPRANGGAGLRPDYQHRRS